MDVVSMSRLQLLRNLFQRRLIAGGDDQVKVGCHQFCEIEPNATSMRR